MSCVGGLLQTISVCLVLLVKLYKQFRCYFSTLIISKSLVSACWRKKQKVGLNLRIAYSVVKTLILTVWNKKTFSGINVWWSHSKVFIFFIWWVSFARQLFPHSGLHEEVPKVSPDPGVCWQWGRQRKPKRRRRRDGDGEALHDWRRRPAASQAGTFPALPVIASLCQMHSPI